MQSTSPAFLEGVRTKTRHVLCTGSKDSNLTNTKDVYESYNRARFTCMLQNIEGMGHAQPETEDFDKGLEFLDAPLRKGADALYKSAGQLEGRKKLGLDAQ